jgi:hypothetical protein
MAITARALKDAVALHEHIKRHFSDFLRDITDSPDFAGVVQFGEKTPTHQVFTFLDQVYRLELGRPMIHDHGLTSHVRLLRAESLKGEFEPVTSFDMNHKGELFIGGGSADDPVYLFRKILGGLLGFQT